MPHVPEPVLASGDGRQATGVQADLGRQLADGVHDPAADVVRAEAAGGGGCRAVEGSEVGAGDVAHVHEVATLGAVLEHSGRLAAFDGAAKQ